MKQDQFARILAFLRQLEQAKIAYQLRHSRDDAIMVRINVPGERWEVEFLQDEDVEIERFVGDGAIYEASILEELFRLWSGDEALTEATVSQKDDNARK